VVSGTAIGVVMTALSATTRAAFSNNALAVERREQMLCLVVIWGLAVALGLTETSLLAVPAAIGSIHALASGTPTRLAVYAGHVPRWRRRICIGLPIAMLSVIAIGWTVVGVWAAISWA
jgi:hypothetical protein